MHVDMHLPLFPLGHRKIICPLRRGVTIELGIQQPILLAPMAAVSGGALAAAVSNAGGLGVIGGGYGDKEWLQRELLAAGNAPVGIGFISWALQKCPDLLNVALARESKAIFLSFGENPVIRSSDKESRHPVDWPDSNRCAGKSGRKRGCGIHRRAGNGSRRSWGHPIYTPANSCRR